MIIALYILMILHVVIFHVDEYYFHRKRTLNRNEVVSMFIDGGLYFIPLVIAIFAPITPFWNMLYIVIAILSSLSVVKNELFYESINITKLERLSHALLYILHPVLLYSFYISWKNDYFVHNLSFWMTQVLYLGFGVKTLTHQFIYWNYIKAHQES